MCVSLCCVAFLVCTELAHAYVPGSCVLWWITELVLPSIINLCYCPMSGWVAVYVYATEESECTASSVSRVLCVNKHTSSEKAGRVTSADDRPWPYWPQFRSFSVAKWSSCKTGEGRASGETRGARGRWAGRWTVMFRTPANCRFCWLPTRVIYRIGVEQVLDAEWLNDLSVRGSLLVCSLLTYPL